MNYASVKYIIQKNIDIVYAYKSTKISPTVRLFKADGDQDRPQKLT